MSFFEELKRRNVFKVGVAYAIVAWLLLQVIVVVLPTFNAPQWVTQTLMFAIFLGFPLALILAWAFELTPDGIKPTSQIDPDTSLRPHTGQRINLLIISGLSLAVVFLLVENYVLDGTAPVPAQTAVADTNSTEAVSTETISLEKSIAVLPFANLSSDQEQEYFSDGLAEEVLNKLAQVSDLQVAARTSSFYFKGRNEDMRAIGEQLGVNYLLEGSVRKAGDNLRITAQLIQAADGFHLWSDTFDRNLEDVFAIQDEIASAVTRALQITLGSGEFAVSGSTRNVEAFDLVLQVRALDLMGNPDRQPQEDLLLRATELDPAFGEALLRLATLYRDRVFLRPAGESQTWQARSAGMLARAEAVAPDMVGLKLFQYDELLEQNRYGEAETILVEMYEQYRTSHALVNLKYGDFLRRTGRFDQALPYLEQAMRLDPMILESYITLAQQLIYMGRLAEAQAMVDKGLQVSGGAAGILPTVNWGIARARGGNAAWAERVLAEIPKDANPVNQHNRRMAELLLMEDRQAAIAELTARANDPDLAGIYRNSVAIYAAFLGANDLALELMRDFNPALLFTPLFAEVRKLPGFKDLMRERGLLDYWRNSGNWPDLCRPLTGNDDFECF